MTNTRCGHAWTSPEPSSDRPSPRRSRASGKERRIHPAAALLVAGLAVAGGAAAQNLEFVVRDVGTALVVAGAVVEVASVSAPNNAVVRTTDPNGFCSFPSYPSSGDLVIRITVPGVPTKEFPLRRDQLVNRPGGSLLFVQYVDTPYSDSAAFLGPLAYEMVDLEVSDDRPLTEVAGAPRLSQSARRLGRSGAFDFHGYLRTGFGTVQTLDRATAERRRVQPSLSGDRVPVEPRGDLDEFWDRAPFSPPLSSGSARAAAAAGSNAAFSLVSAAELAGPAFAEVSFDPDGNVEDFTITPLDDAFVDLAETMDREEGPRFLFHDLEEERFFELDATGQSSGSFTLGGAGTVLGEIFGGLETQATPVPGGGTLVFYSYSSQPLQLFDFDNCRKGQSRQRLAELDAAGDLVVDAELGAFATQLGHGCFPPHTQETRDVEYGESWGIAYQSGDEILLTTRALASGSEPRTYSLGRSPAALDGIFLWRPALWSDADSGAFLVDIPNGPQFEGAEDGERLGFGPWPLDNPALDLPVISSGELLTHALVGDLAGGAWLVGTFDRRTLDGAAAAGTQVVAEVALPGCLDRDAVFCANHNRFAVTARFRTADGVEGDAHARPLGNDSGTFWFFDRDNRELIVKVLDACAVNGHYWFFAAGLTDVEVALEVWDKATGFANLYLNPLGRTFVPILDTTAFECSEAARTGSERAVDPPPLATAIATAGSDGTACGGDTEDLCLVDGRFRVEVDFTGFDGVTAPAFGGQLTDETGALFFFDRSNVEMLIKILDACVFGNYWVFAAGLTNVGVEVRVIDTATGATRVYRNPVGRSFEAITDTAAFACS
jgi:hypothetical protein